MFEELEAVHHRHHEVEDDHARTDSSMNELERFTAVPRHMDLVPAPFQHLDDDLGNVDVVLHHKHLPPHRATILRAHDVGAADATLT